VLAAAVAGCSAGKPGKKPKKPVDERARANRRATDLNIRGNYHRDLMEYDSALAYYRAALAVGEQHRLGKRMEASLEMMGTVYADRAHCEPGHFAPADMDSAEDCFDRAYRICTDSGWQEDIPGLLGAKATVYMRYPRFIGMAESLFLQGRRLAQEMNKPLDEGNILFNYGQVYAVVAATVSDTVALKTAAAMLDTAAMALTRAKDKRGAGAAEVRADDVRALLADLRRGARPGRKLGGDR
jgi:tetratricopeptide (TPR) repeat protein